MKKKTILIGTLTLSAFVFGLGIFLGYHKPEVKEQLVKLDSDNKEAASVAASSIEEMEKIPFIDANFRKDISEGYAKLELEDTIDWTEYERLLNEKEEVTTYLENQTKYIEYMDKLNKDPENAGDPVEKPEVPAIDDGIKGELQNLNEKLSKVKKLSSTSDVSDLTGLELLTGLEEVSFFGTKVTELDVSQNTALTNLRVTSLVNDDNYVLTSLDLSHNEELATLDITYEKLSELNLSNNKKLKTISVRNCGLSSITLPTADGESSATLTYLNLSNNELTDLDLSSYIGLVSVYLSSNNLSNVTLLKDVSDNETLKYLNLSSNNLSSLDLSHFPNLETFEFSENEKVIPVDLNKNINLKKIVIQNEGLTNIALPKLPEMSDGKELKLEYLDLSSNSLTERLDLGAYKKLTELRLQNNQLSSIDVSACTNLQKMYLSGNALGSGEDDWNLDLSNLSLLDTLDASNNQIKEITFPTVDGSSLRNVTLSDNKLASVDFSHNKKLQFLKIQNNSLTSLDLSSNENLFELIVSGNPLGINSNRVVMYKGDTKKITEEKLKTIVSDIIKLPDTIKIQGGSKPSTLTLNTIKKNSDGLNRDLKTEESVKSLELSSSVPGEYDLILEYLHNFSYSNPARNNVLASINFKVNVVKLESSDKNYVISDAKGFVVAGTDTDKDIILGKLNLKEDGSNEAIKVEVDTDTHKVKITYKEETIKEYDLITYTSEEYDLTKDYIYLGKNNFDESKITVTGNATVTEENGYVYIKSGDVVVRKYLEVTYTSDYNLEDDYIYLGTEERQDITVTEDSHVTTSYEEGVFKIIYTGEEEEPETLAETKFVTISSSEDSSYVLGSNYIYIQNNSFEQGKLVVTNGTIETVDDDTIKIKYGDERTSSNIDIVSYKINSDTYKVGKGYIYVGKQESILKAEAVKENVTVTNGETKAEEYVLKIMKGGEELDSFDIISYSSEKYDLSKEYTYIGSASFAKSSINIPSILGEQGNNKLEITYSDGIISLTYNGEVLASTKAVAYTFSNYHDYLNKDYIYVGKNISTLNTNFIRLINGVIETTNHDDNDYIKEINIKYSSEKEILKTYKILGLTLGSLNENKGIIDIKGQEFTYDEFISNVKAYGEGLTYKIYKGSDEVTEGKMTSGMTLEVLYSGETLETYTISSDYLEFVGDTNPDENKFIEFALETGKTINDLLDDVNTSGTKKIVDKNNSEKKSGNLATGDKLVVTLTEGTVEYTIIVMGDVNGDGSVSVADARITLRHIIKSNYITDENYIKAANVDGNRLSQTDVRKILTYAIKKGAL